MGGQEWIGRAVWTRCNGWAKLSGIARALFEYPCTHRQTIAPAGFCTVVVTAVVPAAAPVSAAAAPVPAAAQASLSAAAGPSWCRQGLSAA